MERDEVPNMNFRGFMADNAMANWNAIRIIYGSGLANEKNGESGKDVFAALD